MKVSTTKAVWWTAIIGTGLATTLAGVWVYKQMKKLEDYKVEFQKLIVRKVTKDQIIMDIFMLFKNNSNMTVTLSKQVYDIYANDVYITTMTNDAPNTIEAQTTSTIGMQLNINPAKLIGIGITNPLQLLTKKENITIKIVMKYKVKLLFFSVSIPEIIYKDKLSNLMP
jgi:LEA14-like dessication related protein